MYFAKCIRFCKKMYKISNLAELLLGREIKMLNPKTICSHKRYFASLLIQNDIPSVVSEVLQS